MVHILSAKNLAEAFVKVREALNYTGFLNFEVVSKQNPVIKEIEAEGKLLWKQDVTVVKFNPPNQLEQTVYVQF